MNEDARLTDTEIMAIIEHWFRTTTSTNLRDLSKLVVEAQLKKIDKLGEKKV